VRTAIAIMALGFLVQKFDLFLRVAASSLAARPLTPRSQIVGDIAGLLPHRWLSQCSTQSTTYLLRADLLPCTPVGVVPLSTGSQPHPPIVIATPPLPGQIRLQCAIRCGQSTSGA
jgi:hypothetical protein